MERIDLNHPITEDDIVNFLVTSPDFFTRHAEMLSAVTIPGPHGSRAVSLQERQAEMLREKIKQLEHKMVDLVRNAHENAVIADKLEQWACRLLRTDEPAELPALIASELAARFDVPQVAIKLWDVDAPFADAPFAQGAGDDARIFASALAQPFCGTNPGFEVVDWLDEPAAAVSLALIPLRFKTRAERALAGAAASDAPLAADPLAAVRIEPTPAAPPDEKAEASAQGLTIEPACGLLVLASSDAKRFQTGMGTEFLERLADLAGAALSRLRAEPG